MNTKNPFSNPYHNHNPRQMFAQLPFEIVDHIVGYLAFKDVRSIAHVCSAFRLPAQVRLFRTIQVLAGSFTAYIDRIESLLSSPHLLQYPSCLRVESFTRGSMQHPSLQLLLNHLPVMSRLRDVYISLESGDYSRVLSALESLVSRREITLSLGVNLAPDLRISNNPLPIHTLELWVDTSNHQVATRLIQKCSQSLRHLRLFLRDNNPPPLPFLPHLSEFFAYANLHKVCNDLDLMSLFPFLDQHPTITRLILSYQFTLSGQPPPNLLPNLQYLQATPPIVERLIPGRPVNDIYAINPSRIAYCFPADIMLRPFRQSFVPVTSLEISASTHFPNDSVINMVRFLPKLRKFTLRWTCNYEVRRLFEGSRYSELIGTRNLSPWKTY